MCSVATGPKNTLPTPAVQRTHMPLNMSVEARARLPTPGKKKKPKTLHHTTLMTQAVSPDESSRRRKISGSAVSRQMH